MKRLTWLTVMVLGALAGAGWAQPVPLAPGLTYERLTRPGPAVIHVLRATLGEATLTPLVVPAGSTVLSTAPLSDVAAAPEPSGTVAAALNGGFTLLDSDQAAPVGLLVADGELLCDAWPTRRSALLISQAGRPSIDTYGLDGTVAGATGAAWPLAGLNRPGRDGELVLYTPRYAAKTAARGGRQVVLHNVFADGAKLTAGTDFTGTVAAIVEGAVNLEIPAGGAIIGGSGAADAWLSARRVGEQVKLRYELTPAVTSVRSAVGGGPRLVRAGQVSVEAAQEGLQVRVDMGRQPRSAVGYDADTLYLVAVDGRQPGYSDGVDLNQLAALMRELGAREAMELDGGGATTMFARDRLINSPSDGQPRALASALLLTTTGVLSTAALPAAPGVQVATVPTLDPGPTPPVVTPLPGTPTSPDTPTATPIPATTGGDVVRLSAEPAEITALVGERVPIRIVGFDGDGRMVTVDSPSLTWNLDPAGEAALGTLAPDGSFTATRAGNGNITVSRDGRLITIPVRIAAVGTGGTTSVPPTGGSGHLVSPTEAFSVLPPAFRPGADYKRAAVTIPDGERKPVDGFEQAGHWVLRTQPLLPAKLELVGTPKMGGERALKVSYDFATTTDARTVFVDFRDNNGNVVPIGTPKAVSVQIYGDGNGHRLRGHYTDKAGAKFTLDFTEYINWDHSWARSTVPLPTGLKGPIVWDGFSLTQTDGKAQTAGYIFLDDFQAIY